MVSEFNSLIDLMKRFPDERSCHQYLASRRWAGYMVCPDEFCGNDKAYVFKDGVRYKCTCCGKIYTAKTGTIFESSKISLTKWFVGLYLVMHKKGISSVQLGKDLGITQKSAWFLLQRLRTVLGNEPDEQLEGTVEIDETFVGGRNKNRHSNKRIKYAPGRGWIDKTPVFGILQRGGKMKALVIPNVASRTLHKTALENIKAGSELMTDGFNGYVGLSTYYQVYSCDHSQGYYVNGDCHTNTLEGAWSQLKRSIIGIYHHVTRKHLQKYVNEFVFRYNYRNLATQQQFDKFIANMEIRLQYKYLIR